jgi:protein-S-isoprenylcysteine O-methyltransferase Ste14
MENLLLALAITVYLVAGFAWQTLRHWRRYGIWPIVFSREAARGQRVLGALFDALFLGILAVGVLHVTVGPQALGVWRLPAAVRIAGWLLLLSGAAVTLVAQRQMGASWRVGIDDRPTDLVTTGLFHYVRNPIFSGLLIFAAGVACLSPAWWSVVAWILAALGLRFQVGFEEQHLIALHGDAYLAYAARAGRFVPLVGRLRAAPSIRPGRAPAATRG